MLLYIDESGSINNHNASHCPNFVIALVRVLDLKQAKRSYKRFVSKYWNRLKELDADKYDKNGHLIRKGGKMFLNDKFVELKGTQFDSDMKKNFVDFFAKCPSFEVYFIQMENGKLCDEFCQNTARAFNYAIRRALKHFIKYGYLPDEKCYLQLDERNERPESQYFLVDYLNTELIFSDGFKGPYYVQYFDSSQSHIIQIADIFANLLYSHLLTGAYRKEFALLESKKIVKKIYKFPLK